MVVDNLGLQLVSSGGRKTTAIAAGTAGNTLISAKPGRLCRVLVTTAGSNGMRIHDSNDGVTGTIIGALAANAAVGCYDFDMPVENGITVDGDGNNPAVTISFIETDGQLTA